MSGVCKSAIFLEKLYIKCAIPLKVKDDRLYTSYSPCLSHANTLPRLLKTIPSILQLFIFTIIVIL